MIKYVSCWPSSLACKVRPEGTSSTERPTPWVMMLEVEGITGPGDCENLNGTFLAKPSGGIAVDGFNYSAPVPNAPSNINFIEFHNERATFSRFVYRLRWTETVGDFSAIMFGAKDISDEPIDCLCHEDTIPITSNFTDCNVDNALVTVKPMLILPNGESVPCCLPDCGEY